ncbi:MAG: O-methyltransferase [Phycisphaerales bacterium]
MEMTPDRWEFLTRYAAEVFGRPDHQLATLMSRAAKAGLPDIAISPDVGRLLKMLASMTNAGRGASLILELGTLAGYSGIWLARALAPGGKLVTIELEPAHADFAQREFTVAGLAGRVELVRGAALEVLPALAARFGDASVDVAFIDAVKTEYPDYFRLLRPLIKPGGLFIADNALGSNWTMDQPPGSSPERDAVDRMNRMVAADRDFEAACIMNRQGLVVARRL